MPRPPPRCPPPGCSQARERSRAQNQAAGTSQVRPSPAQPPSMAPQCPGSRSGRLCSTLGPSLPFPPGLENLELSHLLRGASVQKGLPCPWSQPQLELEAAGQAVLDPRVICSSCPFSVAHRTCPHLLYEEQITPS